MARVVGHIDLDYFYAQVEEVQNHTLKDKPTLVCVYSGRTQDSGVVSTANYRARELGIKSGVPISLARKRLEGKDAAFIRMEHSKYEKISGRVMDALREEVDVLEQGGIDEAFFDITRASEADYAKAARLASNLKGKVMQEEGLTSSVGIGPSKAVAKIASDFRKPDGLTVVTPSEVQGFLAPLEVTRLYGVGPQTSRILEGAGIRRIGEFASADIQVIEKLLGKKTAIYLHGAANGSDEEPVRGNLQMTQLSRLVTLRKNTRSAEEAFEQLSPLIEDLHSKLLSRSLSFRSVSVIGILADLSTKTKSRTLEAPTNDPKVLSAQIRELLDELSDSVDKELRRAGVRVSDFVNVADQTSLTQYMG